MSEAAFACIAHAAELTDVPMLRLLPGQAMFGCNAQSGIRFASGQDGVQLSADNQIENLRIATEPATSISSRPMRARDRYHWRYRHPRRWLRQDLTDRRRRSEMERTVIQAVSAETVVDDGDMRLLRALPSALRISVGPFVFIDHYRHQGTRGIGDRPHPHAGIEVVSYLLEGGVEHRDSMGSRDRLAAGDAQFIRAGRGMLHAEQPLSARHGLQLWLSLPPALKLVEPSYTSIRAADIPRVDGPGSHLYVIAGMVNGVQGPMALSGDAVFARLQLDPGSQVVLDVDSALELSLYVLQGSIDVGGSPLAAGTLGVLGNGNRVNVSSPPGERAVEVALIGGSPAQGQILFSGPFVMDTPERLAQAKRDFTTGRMGRMEGVPF